MRDAARTRPRTLRRLVSVLSAGVISAAMLIALPAAAQAAPSVSTSKQELAQYLVSASNSGTFSSVTAGTINAMIVPISQGRTPSQGCDVSLTVLQTLVLTHQRFGSVRISDLARTCAEAPTWPSCAGREYSKHCMQPGRAIDFVAVGGQSLSGGTDTDELLRYIDTFAPSGTNAGQSNCGGSVSLGWISRFEDSCDHLHLDLPGGSVRGGAESSSTSGTVMQVYGANTGWQKGNTGVTIGSSQISAVNMGGTWPQLMANEGGTIMQIAGMSGGWKKMSTGVTVAAGSPISAVNMGGGWPQVMANEGGTIMQIAVVGGKWTKMSTGVTVAAGSPISAVNMGGGWPQVMVNEGGTIMQVAVVGGKWTKMSTGVTVAAGSPISAVSLGGTWPQVMVNDGGTIMQVAAMTGGWKKMSTSVTVAAGSPISAVNMGGAWPQVVANEGGTIMQIAVVGGKWTKMSTGVTSGSGSAVSAVNMGGTWPQVMTAH